MFKKILPIILAGALTTVGSSAIVSCGTQTESKASSINTFNKKSSEYRFESPTDWNKFFIDFCLVNNVEPNDFIKNKDNLRTLQKAYGLYDAALTFSTNSEGWENYEYAKTETQKHLAFSSTFIDENHTDTPNIRKMPFATVITENALCSYSSSLVYDWTTDTVNTLTTPKESDREMVFKFPDFENEPNKKMTVHADAYESYTIKMGVKRYKLIDSILNKSVSLKNQNGDLITFDLIKSLIEIKNSEPANFNYSNEQIFAYDQKTNSWYLTLQWMEITPHVDNKITKKIEVL